MNNEHIAQAHVLVSDVQLDTVLVHISVAEPRGGAEIKLPSGAEITIPALTSFYLSKT
jgi:hypothetical protein